MSHTFETFGRIGPLKPSRGIRPLATKIKYKLNNTYRDYPICLAIRTLLCCVLPRTCMHTALSENTRTVCNVPPLPPTDSHIPSKGKRAREIITDGTPCSTRKPRDAHEPHAESEKKTRECTEQPYNGDGDPHKNELELFTPLHNPPNPTIDNPAMSLPGKNSKAPHNRHIRITQHSSPAATTPPCT